MTSARSPRKPFVDSPVPVGLAHRGAHDGAEVIENTMSAFAAAVDLGYRYVETDVHATADGVLVAFHDDRLDRVTDRQGLIRELPWSEVKAAQVGRNETVPLLENLLGAWPQLRVNIDPKHDSAIDPLVTVLERSGAIERVCVGAFSDRRISRVRNALGRRLCTGMGPAAIARLRLASYGVPTGSFANDCAQVPVKQGRVTLVDERFVHAAHDRDIAVHVWTIDDEAEMERLLDLGVDGLMTDRAVLLRDVLQRRGAWT
jgi:glycerophosphoryl diester phosphodiesterase